MALLKAHTYTTTYTEPTHPTTQVPECIYVVLIQWYIFICYWTAPILYCICKGLKNVPVHIHVDVL